MGEATQIAIQLFERFPRDDAVGALREGRAGPDPERLRELAWPDFEVAMVGAGSAEFRTDRRGPEGLLEGWRDWLEPFGSHRTEFEGIREAGDDCAVIFVRQIARPKGSEMEAENLGAAVVWTREGKLSRLEFHLDRGLALKAAGLPPD
jgi:ketosteroid isomerase-like protein